MLGHVQAFVMYGGIGMSAPSLNRESTDYLICGERINEKHLVGCKPCAASLYTNSKKSACLTELLDIHCSCSRWLCVLHWANIILAQNGTYILHVTYREHCPHCYIGSAVSLAISLATHSTSAPVMLIVNSACVY